MEVVTQAKDRQLIPPLFQIGCMFFTSLLLTAMFGYRFSFFKERDPRIAYNIITPAKFKEFGSFSNEVPVGLYIDEFEQFSIIKNEFVFTGQVWFMVLPGSLSLETLEKFSFARGEILHRSSPYLKIVDEHLFVQYNIRVRINSPLSLVDFPLDNHTICIQLEHLYTHPSEVSFDPALDNFRIEANLKPFGWVITDKQIKSGYIERKLDSIKNGKVQYYPSTLFYFDVIRYGVQHTLTIFLPLVLIFFVILFCFSVQESSVSFSLAIGGLTTILAYRFVIVNMSPQVGYAMLTDYIFLFILGSGVCIFLIHVSDKFYDFALTLRFKKCVLITMHILINSVSFYLLYH
jgi:hypothetical protein